MVKLVCSFLAEVSVACVGYSFRFGAWNLNFDGLVLDLDAKFSPKFYYKKEDSSSH
jgi:hypothetical protein